MIIEREKKMKIEKLDISNNKLKVGIIIGFILAILIVILINFFTSRANYRNTESIELAKGTINYSLADLNVIAMYKIEGGKDVDIDTVPTEGYTLSERSYCTVPDSEAQIKDIIDFDYFSKELNIKVNKKGTKCYLYFEEYKTPSEQMVAKLEARTGKPYTTSPMPAISSTDTTSSTGKLYTTQDNYGISYVFRGNVQDNWVTFANKRWRIIRINGDGTLRLIYQCGSASCTDTTGNNTQINGGNDIAYNAKYNDNTYVGYYNLGKASKYPDAHQGKNPSTIAKYINDWYSGTGAMTNYTQYLSGNTGFCNDRQIAQVSRSSYNNYGYGASYTAYAAVDRFMDASWSSLATQTPDLRCGVDPKTKIVDKAALQRDLYTTSDETGDGNGILTYPVGLITADEVAMAGGKDGTGNSSYYLYTNNYYWTMSPFYFYTSGWAGVFGVGVSGGLSFSDVSNAWGVRPVINLKANITFSGGNGTSGSPFVVATN